MSSIDERVVNLKFNNGQFEAGAQKSLSTLEKLKSALKLDASSKGLDNLQRASRSFSMANVVDNVQTVANRFSALGIIGDQVLRRITDSALNMGKTLLTAIPNQIISGGKARAQKIEQAKFQLKGLLGEEEFTKQWDLINQNINDAVAGTAYGYDAAAAVASQLRASNIQFGDDMAHALRGVSGVAAMTNSSYEEIGHIFTTIAGQGKVMTEQLNQFANRGLNVAATLAEKFKVSEAQLREMVTKGKVDFKSFAEAMNDAFGEHATKANETFTGALSNVKASLSRMGAQFAIPGFESLRKVLVALIPVLKQIEQLIKPISQKFEELANNASSALEKALKGAETWLERLVGTQQKQAEQNQAIADTQAQQADAVEDTKAAYAGFGGITKVLKQTNDALKSNTKSYEELEKVANEVISGKYGSGEARKKAVEELGFSFEAVQNKVNELLGSTKRYEESVDNITDATRKQAESAKEATENYEQFGGIAKVLHSTQKDHAEAAKETVDAYAGFGGIAKVLRKTNDEVEKSKKEYEGLDQIIQDVVSGKYGSGADRKKALEDMGLSYAIVQNKVNEYLGSSKRYEVTAEDEAKMNKYFGKSAQEVVETLTEGTEISSKFENALKGVGAALHIITSAASSLYDNIVKPFASWAIPKAIDAILTPLGALGTKIVELDKKLTETDFFNTKFKAIANGFITFKNNFKEFIKSAGELEGIQKLSAAFGRLKEAIGNAWNTAKATLGEGLTNLWSNIKLPGMDFFLGILDTVTGKVADFINLLLDNKASIEGFFTPFTSIGAGAIDLVGKAFGKLFEVISGTKLSTDTGAISDFLGLLGKIGGSLGSGIIKGLFELGDGLAQAFGGVTLKNVLNLFTSGAFTKIALDLAGFSGGLSAFGKKLASNKGLVATLGDSFSNAFDKVGTTLTKFQEEIQTKSLMNIAVAVGILAASLVVLSAIDSEKLANGIWAIGALFAELVIAFKLLSTSLSSIQAPVEKGFKGLLQSVSGFGSANQMTSLGAALILLATAVGVLTVSLVSLSKLDFAGLMTGLVGIGALLAMLVAVTKTMKFDNKGAIKTAATLLILAIAVKTLSKALIKLSKLSWEELAKGLTGVIGGLLALAFGLKAMKASGGLASGLMSAGVGMIFMAMAMNIIAGAMKKIGKLSWDEIGKGLLSIAVAIGVIGGVLGLMPDKGMLGAAVGILIVSVALKGLAKVIKSIGDLSWENLTKGLLGLVGALFALAAAVALTSDIGVSAIGAGIGIVLMATAIRILVPALEALGALSVGTIIKSLLALAGVFAVLVIGGAALSAVIGTLFALSAAFLTFGLGMTALGIGIAAVVASLYLLGSVISAIIPGIMGLFTAIIENATLITQAITALGLSILNAVAQLVPELVHTGMVIILALLEGVSTNIYKIVSLVGEIIVEFLNAMSVQLPAIIDAGIRFIAAFINGIAQGLVTSSDIIYGALGNLVTGLATFFIKGLSELALLIPGVGGSISNALKGLIDDVSGGMPKITTALQTFNDALGNMSFLSEETKSELGKQIEALGSLDGSEYSVAIVNLMAYIDGLGLEPEQRRVLIEQVVKELEGDASEKHTVALHNLEIAISNYNIPPEKRKELMDLVADLGNLKEGTYSTTVETVETLINDFDIPDEQKQKLVTAVEDVAKSGAEYGATVEKVNVAMTNVGVDEEGQQKVRDAIKNIGKLLAEGKSEDSEEVQAEIDKINVVFAENGSPEWAPEAREALDKVVEEAYKSEAALEASVSKLDVTLDDIGITGDVREQFKTKVEELLTLAQNGQSDGEEYYIAYHAAVKLLTDQGVDETEARTLLSNYSIEAGDAVTAKFTAIKIALDTSTFGDEDENGFSQQREDLKKQAEEMMKLDGVELDAAIEKFVLDLTNSSIDDQSGEIIAKMGRDAGHIFSSAYNEELAGVMKQVEALRRSEFIGSFTVDSKSGSYITNKSTLAKEIKNEFKDAKSVTDEEIANFAKYIHDEHFSIEDIVTSFGNMGMSDQELAELLFPAGEKAGIDTSKFIELITPLIQSYVTGADEEFKEEISKYGGLDFSEFFQQGTKDGGAESRRAYKEMLDLEIANLRDEMGLYEEDVLTMDMFLGFMDGLDEQARLAMGTRLNEVYEAIKQAIQEGEENGLSEEEVLAGLRTTIEGSLYKVGDGIDTTTAEQSMSEAVSETVTTGVNNGMDQAEAELGKEDRLKELINNFLGGGEGAVDAEAEIKLGLDLGDFAPEDIKDTILNGKDSLGVELPAGVTLDGLAESVTAAFSTPDVTGAETTAGENIVAGVNTAIEGQSGTFNSVMAALGLDGFTGFTDFFGIHSPSTLMEGAGLNVVQGLANGVNSAVIIAKVAMITLASNCLNALTEYIEKFRIAGVDNATSFANGLSSTTDLATSAGRSVGDSAESGIREKIDSAYGLGQDFGDGYVQGVESKTSEAYDAGYALGVAAKEGMQTAQNSNSPSKVAKGLGGDFGMGYIIGIDSFAKKAGRSAAGVADSALKGLRNPLKAIQHVLDSDMDMDPVIRPVLDLSNIQNGARMINRIMPTPNLDLGYVSASLSDVRDPNSEVVSAIMGLTNKVGQPKGDTYNINGITYDDGSNITSAVQTLIHAAKVERRR